MILVAVGTSQFRFDRLLSVIDRLAGAEPVFVQHGPSEIRPRGATCVPFLPMDELAGLIRDARVVVTHAGVGLILLSHLNGKRPYVVPRRRAFDETVDDHQVESARRFAKAGLVTLVEDPERLADALGEGASKLAPLPTEGALVADLRDYVRTVIGSPAGEPA
jgi:UDP-N-acetylglucosamine transferase subunit ALG13